MDNKKIKILFVRPLKSSFIQSDLELLEKSHNVRVVDAGFVFKGLFSIPKKIFQIMRGMLWADMAFVWFADIHALTTVFFSKLFQKKSIVVVGGYEVADVPEMGYGLMADRRRSLIAKIVLKMADRILAVSEFNQKEIFKYAGSKKVELVYNGIDCGNFKPGGKKESLIVTVGSATKNRCAIKGIETFVKASSLLAGQRLRFAVIGSYDKSVQRSLKDISPKVDFTGALSGGQLLFYLKKAKVYCQLSYRESFGMAMAEAMACECVPVATRVAALPEIVGDTGFYVPYGDETTTAKAVKKAIKNHKRGKLARQRIKNNFSIELREEMLNKIIINLHKSKANE